MLYKGAVGKKVLESMLRFCGAPVQWLSVNRSRVPVGALTGLFCGLFAVGIVGCSSDGEGDQLAAGPVVTSDLGGFIDGGPQDGEAADTAIDDAALDIAKPCECPTGYACQDVGNGEKCLPDSSYACAACAGDHECVGGRCATVDGEGPFCEIPCDVGPKGDSCPTGFTCTPFASKPGGEKDIRLCMPDTQSCTCRSEDVGSVRACKAAACAGEQKCEAAGWGLCDAPGATSEQCDGQDNDCDGLTDDDLPAEKTCDKPAPGGVCVGKASCAGAKGWLCDASDAAPEACNALDDDCDGATDEPWLVGGRYVAHEHCGNCANDCSKAFGHAVAACDPNGLPPHCVVVSCDAGYVLDKTGLCVPESKPVCKDNDCTCTSKEAGKTRACTRTNEVGTCSGIQTCQGAAGWDDCTAKVPQAEICDGLDTDCDGQTDEGTTGAACSDANPFGSCPGKLQCAGVGGPWCDADKPTSDTCNGLDDDCDGQTDEGVLDPASGQYLHVDHCGGCGNGCPKPIDPNSAAICSLKSKKATCALSCKPGYHDANGALADGCECKFISQDDAPPIGASGGGDLNCDGIDGVIAKSVFVAKTGSDANPGTRVKPVLTIGKGIALAAQNKLAWVLIAAGAYYENVTLSPGISLIGGYGKGFAVHDPTAWQSTLVGLAPTTGDAAALRCTGFTVTTYVAGMRILGAHATAVGASTAAVVATGCSGLVMRNNTIVAGDGAAGAHGLSGANGGPGATGNKGLTAKDIGHTVCTSSDHLAGAAGAKQKCGAVVVDGGQGGTSACPDYNVQVKPPQCSFNFPYNQKPTSVEYGKSGSGPAGGGGGLPGGDGYTDKNDGKASNCKVAKYGCDDCVVAQTSFEGKDGQPGGLGTTGLGGGGCSGAAGSFVGATFKGGAGGLGGLGGPGGGGGGGGSAGGVETVGCANESGKYSDLGGSGGGGGAGGCGGGGGQGGAPGGGSFGVIVVADGKALPALGGAGKDANSIQAGNGGTGGRGGAGGFGGIGGQGGHGGDGAFGVEATKCAMPGGAGGVGGPGGHGGGGGGGCGGPSVALSVIGSKPHALWVNQATAGKGGEPGDGGNSGGINGHAGGPGLAAATRSWP